MPQPAGAEPAVVLTQVTLSYGDYVAVDRVTLDFASWRLRHPSRSLRLRQDHHPALDRRVVQPTAGDIQVAGRRIDDVPIHKRNIGLVFQNYALFPTRRCSTNRLRPQIPQCYERSVQAAQGQARPRHGQLPGVDASCLRNCRAASSSASRSPAPSSSSPTCCCSTSRCRRWMPICARKCARAEIIQREVGITTIFVTHDQEEALAMSDRIVVVNHGRVGPTGTPETSTATPPRASSRASSASPTCSMAASRGSPTAWR